MSEEVFILLSTVGPLSVTLALIVVGLLSQRLGAVTKMPPHYRWFFVAASLTGSSVVVRLLGVSVRSQDTLSLLYAVLFALGVTLGVVVAWYYWSWLFGERET